MHVKMSAILIIAYPSITILVIYNCPTLLPIITGLALAALPVPWIIDQGSGDPSVK